MEDFKKALNNFLKKNNYKTINLKAVLFDMDGVLFDSMKGHTISWQRTFSKLNIPTEQDEFYLFEGCTGAQTINEIFNRTFNRNASEDEIKAIYDIKTCFFNELPESKPMPCAKDVLKQVMEKGLKPVLVTGSGQKTLLDRIEKVYKNTFDPDNIVTAYDVEKGKPDPEPYLAGLEKAGVKPNEAIVVENAPMGVQAGVAAGIFTIAVNSGPIPDHILLDAGADFLLPDMKTLSGKFEQIFSAISSLD